MASSSSGPPPPTARDTFTAEMRDRAARGLDPYDDDDEVGYGQYGALSADEAGGSGRKGHGAKNAKRAQAARKRDLMDGGGKISLRAVP